MDAKDATRISIESGRLLLMPVRKRLTGPMHESFVLVNVPMRSKWVQVRFGSLPNRQKKCTSFVCVRAGGSPDAKAVVSSAAPYLYVGDPVFYFSSIESRQEVYQRAIKCCEPPKSIGSFRTDCGEIAACIRVGGKNAIYRFSENFIDPEIFQFDLNLEEVDDLTL